MFPEYESVDQRPNIVLVCVDQMRFDAMSCAGNGAIDTPNLDQLAAGGNRFTRAYSSTPTCVPARVALFTGKSPALHGRYGYREGIDFPAAYPITMQGELRAAGYQSFGVGKMHVYPERARCGFDDVLLHDGFLHVSRRGTRGPSYLNDDYLSFLRRETGDPNADPGDTGAGCNQLVARPWEREERLHPTRWVADESIRFLERRDPTRPFFLYASFHRPHAPFDPPRWLWDKYRARELPQPAMGDWVEHFEQYRHEGHTEREFTRLRPEVQRDIIAGYFGSIEFIDLQLYRLREALTEHGVMGNTAILFVSDHGDMMGDHDLYRKSVGYEGSSHIPFLLHLPPRLREKWGPAGEVESIVELRDVMPTVLDIAGVSIPEGVDGCSVRPLLAGAGGQDSGSDGSAAGADDHLASEGGGAWREHLHGEHVIGQLGYHSMQWVLSERYKYLWFSGDGHEQLFDLENDPYEERDLAGDPEYASVLEQHRVLLAKELADREEGFVTNGQLTPGAPIRSEAEWVREFARL